MRDAGRGGAGLRQVGLAASPDTRVGQLIVAEKQLVEIAKALARRARVLIMDEPTATLTRGETERLFGLMAQLQQAGTTIVYISHKLDEVERVTDEVVVMRDGCFITRQPTAGLGRHAMANLMVGRELTDLFPPKQLPAPDAPVALQVQASRCRLGPRREPRVRAGEIWFRRCRGRPDRTFEGFWGCGRGRSRRWDRRRAAAWQPAPSRQRGLTYLSEDRKGKGLHVHMGWPRN